MPSTTSLSRFKVVKLLGYATTVEPQLVRGGFRPSRLVCNVLVGNTLWRRESESSGLCSIF